MPINRADGITLLVTPEELYHKSSEISGKVDVVKQKFDAIESLVTKSVSYWIGQAGESHREVYLDKSADIEEIIRRFGEHAQDLSEMARNYAGWEAEIQSMMDELPSDVII